MHGVIRITSIFPLTCYATVNDELVKVVRVGNISFQIEVDKAASRIDEEFTSQVLSGVRFAPLVLRPSIPTVLPSHVWDPSVQRFYPSEHQRATMEIMMCSNSKVMQPLPPVPRPEEMINAAAMLPKSVWVEILSYTHRKCKSNILSYPFANHP